MSNYLLLYRSEQSADQQMAAMTPEEGEAEMRRWAAWGESVGERMVDFGNPTADSDGIGGSHIGGYSILSAENREELDALIAEHPHHSAGTIQVLEILAIPGM